MIDTTQKAMLPQYAEVTDARSFAFAYGHLKQPSEGFDERTRAFVEEMWEVAHGHGKLAGQIEASKAAQALVDEKAALVDDYAAKIRELQEILRDERIRADQAVESAEMEGSRREALERQLGMAARKVESLQAANVRLINEQSFHYRFWRRVARYASDQVASHGPN